MSGSADLLNQIDQVARAAVSHWGATTIDDVAAATKTDPALAGKVLGSLPGFSWLDESSGWFWIENMPRNSLLTQIRKILVVATTIDVGELRSGVGRHHRRKGFSPPRRVLRELCRQLSWCRVAGEKIVATEPLNPNNILSDSEQITFRVLKEYGPVMRKQRFEELCLYAGMNQHTFGAVLSYCPIIIRYAPEVYGLRGAELTAGLVESLMPKHTGKSKLLVDFGWTNDRNLQIVYKVSRGMLSSGVVSIPIGLRPFVNGKFTLRTADGYDVGTLVVKNNTAWGLGPFFSRRGGETDDYLRILFDLTKREASVHIGDASFLDEVRASGAPEAGKIGANSEMGVDVL
jgi:hypothetical protein